MVSPYNGRLAGGIRVYGVDDGLSLALLVDLAKPSAGLSVRCLPLEILLILIHIVHLQTEERFEWDSLSLSLSLSHSLLTPHPLPPLLLVLCKNRSGCASLSVCVCVCVCVCGLSLKHLRQREAHSRQKGKVEKGRCSFRGAACKGLSEPSCACYAVLTLKLRVQIADMCKNQTMRIPDQCLFFIFAWYSVTVAPKNEIKVCKLSMAGLWMTVNEGGIIIHMMGISCI